MAQTAHLGVEEVEERALVRLVLLGGVDRVGHRARGALSVGASSGAGAVVTGGGRRLRGSAGWPGMR